MRVLIFQYDYSHGIDLQLMCKWNIKNINLNSNTKITSYYSIEKLCNGNCM